MTNNEQRRRRRREEQERQRALNRGRPLSPTAGEKNDEAGKDRSDNHTDEQPSDSLVKIIFSWKSITSVITICFSALFAFIPQRFKILAAACGLCVGVFLIVHRVGKEWTRFVRYGLTLCLSGVILLLCYLFSERQFSRSLRPGNEPVETFAGVIDSTMGGLAFLSAGNNLFEFPKGTNPVAVLRFEEKTLLSIQRTDSGVFLSGEFLNRNGDVVAVIERNRIITNSDNILEMEIGKSRLFIRSKQNEVLELKHPNPSIFILTGSVRLPDGQLAVFSDNDLLIGGRRYQHVAFSNFGTIVQIGDGHGSIAAIRIPLNPKSDR